MKLNRLGEFGFIDRIRASVPKANGVRLGIGDDAAWVASPFRSLLVTADLLIEDIHFNLEWTSLFDLGYKSLAVNLSDIAAMGGIPAYVMLSLGIPPDFRVQDLDEFYRGVKNHARHYGVSIVGGDTSIASPLFISVCLLGHAPYRPVTRKGAKNGDDIYVTGTLGDAALALHLLRDRSLALRHRSAKFLLRRHHHPTPRCRIGALLARQKLATAMIDVSDGLLQDLGHICRASDVGAMIQEHCLPLSRSYRMLSGKEGSRWALSGGEDYELLFCARPKARAAIHSLAKRVGVVITRIGACVPKREKIIVLDRQGKRVETPMLGHDHFRARNSRPVRRKPSSLAGKSIHSL